MNAAKGPWSGPQGIQDALNQVGFAEDKIKLGHRIKHQSKLGDHMCLGYMLFGTTTCRLEVTDMSTLTGLVGDAIWRLYPSFGTHLVYFNDSEHVTDEDVLLVLKQVSEWLYEAKDAFSH